MQHVGEGTRREEEQEDGQVGDEEEGNAGRDKRGERPGGLRERSHAKPPLTWRQRHQQQRVRHVHEAIHPVLICTSIKPSRVSSAARAAASSALRLHRCAEILRKGEHDALNIVRKELLHKH